VFHKYFLGGDTMAPSRLYAMLCRVFFFSCVFSFRVKSLPLTSSSTVLISLTIFVLYIMIFRLYILLVS